MFDNRNDVRQFFMTAWQKHNQQQPLTDLEKQLVAIIKMHPEYHAHLNKADSDLDKDYRMDNNPFLHMGLHLSLLEQLTTNRPTGIIDIYKQLCQQYGDAHQAEHAIMEVIGEMLWEAQQNKTLPNDDIYMAKLKQLTSNPK